MACPTEESLQAYLDRELPAEVASMTRLHLDGCPKCAASLREMELAFDSMREAFEVEAPVVATSARLRARLESSMAGKPGKEWMPHWLRWAAIPATLVVAAMVWLWFPPSSNSSRGAAVVAPVAQSSLPERNPVKVQPKFDAKQRRLSRRPSLRPEAEAAADVEEVTEFFTLREGDELPTSQGIRLVRVELTSSALIEAGFPLALLRGNTEVTADVILAEDGLARSIRFVR